MARGDEPLGPTDTLSVLLWTRMDMHGKDLLFLRSLGGVMRNIKDKGKQALTAPNIQEGGMIGISERINVEACLLDRKASSA